MTSFMTSNFQTAASPRFAQLDKFGAQGHNNGGDQFTSIDSMNFQPPNNNFTQLGNGSSTNLSEISSNGQNSLLSNHSVQNLPGTIATESPPPQMQQHPPPQQLQPQQIPKPIQPQAQRQAGDSTITSTGTSKYVYFARKPDLLSKSSQDKAASIKLTLENYYTLSVNHAIERNQRRLDLEHKIMTEEAGSSEERKNRQLQNLGKKESQF